MGEIYEERSRKDLGDFPITSRITGFWDRSDTEIDLVAVNQEERRLRFGSCKRSPAKLVSDINNFKGHVDRFRTPSRRIVPGRSNSWAWLHASMTVHAPCSSGTTCGPRIWTTCMRATWPEPSTNHGGTVLPNSDARKEHLAMEGHSQPSRRRRMPQRRHPARPLLPERSDFLEGDAPAAAKVEAFLAQALAATGSEAPTTAGRSCPGSAMRCCRTTRSRPTAATSWTSCGTCRRRASTPLEVTADHVKLYKRALLEAGRKSATVAQAAVGPPRDLQAACGQGTGVLGDGPGHRCGQGPRRAEELHTVLDPAAGHFDLGGDSDRHLAGDPRPGADERLLPHRLPGLGGGRGLRGAPRDRWRRALSPRHREAEQEAAEDPA